MKLWLIYGAAAFCEIVGCFAFWSWLREDRPAWLLLPGIGLLIAFAWLLTLVEVPNAGRAFAAYGGIYIVASLFWLRFAEGVTPDRWDLVGGAICLCGAVLILWGPGRS